MDLESRVKPAGIHRPPSQSTGVLSDIRCFFLKKPALPTLIQFRTKEERQNYSHRIMQRIGIDVSEYVIMNLHKIGINAPVRYVFEELLKWNGDSTCWPNHLAQVERIDGRLENIRLFLCGWRSYPFGFRRGICGLSFIPLFNLNAKRFQTVPPSSDCDNARYLLYECSGGYPIGIFSMYARSSIAEQHETEATQVFLAVGVQFLWKRKLVKNQAGQPDLGMGPRPGHGECHEQVQAAMRVAIQPDPRWSWILKRFIRWRGFPVNKSGSCS